MLAARSSEYETIAEHCGLEVCQRFGPKRKLRVLDIGAGFSALCGLPCLQERVSAYHAFEPNPCMHEELFAAAVRLCGEDAAHVTKALFTTTSEFPADCDPPNFDLIVFCHSLYSAGELSSALIERAVRHLAPEGVCMIFSSRSPPCYLCGGACSHLGKWRLYNRDCQCDSGPDPISLTRKSRFSQLVEELT